MLSLLKIHDTLTVITNNHGPIKRHLTMICNQRSGIDHQEILHELGYQKFYKLTDKGESEHAFKLNIDPESQTPAHSHDF